MFARSPRTTTIVLTVSFVLCALLLLGITARYLHLNTLQMGRSQNRALHTVQMISTARSLRLAITDAETGQRGFILTGDRSYLEPYNDSVAAIPGLLAHLDALTADDPVQRQEAAALKNAVNRKQAVLQLSIDIFDASGFAAAQAFVQANAGRDLMGQIRDMTNTIVGAENTAFTQHVDQAAIEQSHEELILFLTVGGALLVLLGAAAILFEAFRRSKRAHTVLQATVNGVTRGVAAFENGQLVAWNDRIFELLRIPPTLARIGTSISRLEQADSLGLLDDLGVQLQRAADANQNIMVERNGPDGAIFRLFFSPPNHGVAVFGAVDATLRHRSEQFLQNAQKMDALGHLTGGIAHDFNNLLTVVLMNLEVMAQSPAVMEKFSRRVELMTAAAQKGAMLVRQLLAYARKQPLEPEVVDLRDVMPGLVELIKRTIGEDIDVDLNLADEIWPTIVDPAKFESAVLNLALNARDAMPDGGSLVIELSNAALDDIYASRHPEVTAGDYVVVVVSDTGSGMPPEVMARVFDPFFTTKGEGRGTGLGLSMVYGFVTQTGGHIKIDSEPGRGTTIKLYFPRCHDDVSAPAPEQHGTAPTGTETILVVEDDEKVRSTTVGVLHDLGYDTMQAADGQSALDLMENGRPVDLLLTDVVLSGAVNGQKLAETARERHPTIKVLYTSGYAETAVQRHVAVDPLVGLLTKPYRIEELATTLRNVLSRKAG
jgi:signal transduction histidine kinase/CheY-like chemotaxis protein